MDERGCIRDLEETYLFNPMPSIRANVRTRRKREFTPDEQKDSNYWLKRNRNNEAAKRSRQRKRLEEYLLETRAVELQRENENLKVALSAVNHHNTGLKNHMDFAFRYPLGNPSDSCPRSLHAPTTLIPLHGMLYCPCSDRCGTVCPQTSHSNSVYDLALYSGQENVVNTTKLPRISLLDSYHPIGRYSQGTSTCTRGVCSNGVFTYENDASQVLLGLPRSSSPVVNHTRNSRCYSARTSSSETTQNCMRQSGLIQDTCEVPVQTNASEETCQQQPITQSILLPHKLRYKVNNARFVAKYVS